MIERLAVLVTVEVGQTRECAGVKAFTLETRGVKMFSSHWGKSLQVSDLCLVHDSLAATLMAQVAGLKALIRQKAGFGGGHKKQHFVLIVFWTFMVISDVRIVKSKERQFKKSIILKPL